MPFIDLTATPVIIDGAWADDQPYLVQNTSTADGDGFVDIRETVSILFKHGDGSEPPAAQEMRGGQVLKPLDTVTLRADKANGFWWAWSTAPDTMSKISYNPAPLVSAQQGGGGTPAGGLTSVARDATLVGTGQSGSPLGVANPFTADDEAKLDSIEEGAEANRTAAEIKTAYEDLPDTNAFTDSEKAKVAGLALADIEAAFVGARVIGSGASRQIELTRNSGSRSVTLNVPDTIGGPGGTDGVVTAISFAGTTITLQRSVGDPLTADIAAIRQTLAELGGLTQSQVDARVEAGVEDWAQDGNSDQIPDAKIPASIARDSELPDVSGFLTEPQVDARAAARYTDDEKTKLAGIEAGAEQNPTLAELGGLTQSQVDARAAAAASARYTDAEKARVAVAEQNVQADWDEMDTASDAFIRNKPEISSGGGASDKQVVTLVAAVESTVTLAAALSTYKAIAIIRPGEDERGVTIPDSAFVEASALDGTAVNASTTLYTVDAGNIYEIDRSTGASTLVLSAFEGLPAYRPPLRVFQGVGGELLGAGTSSIDTQGFAQLASGRVVSYRPGFMKTDPYIRAGVWPSPSVRIGSHFAVIDDTLYEVQPISTSGFGSQTLRLIRYSESFAATQVYSAGSRSVTAAGVRSNGVYFIEGLYLNKTASLTDGTSSRIGEVAGSSAQARAIAAGPINEIDGVSYLADLSRIDLTTGTINYARRTVVGRQTLSTFSAPSQIRRQRIYLGDGERNWIELWRESTDAAGQIRLYSPMAGRLAIIGIA